MGEVYPPRPVKLIIAIIARGEEPIRAALPLLTARWGEIDFTGAVLPFDVTDYYNAEMGEGLIRQFISFEQLIDPGELASIKRETNNLEQRFAAHGNRVINLDAGYVALDKLVLATTKNRAHRIYIGQGVYAEVTLLYHRGSYEAWRFTYPDFHKPEYIAELNRIRGVYKEQLRAGGILGG